MTRQELINAVAATPARSAWDRGVHQYALDIIESAYGDDDEGIPSEHALFMGGLLNGARNWAEYSDGGCALIWDQDIARRLCSPSELRRTRDGMRAPNSREGWIDVQTRALYQAAALISRSYNNGRA